jgi:hypothetical protein
MAAASLRSPPPVPAAFRRSRAVVRASSSPSSPSAVSSSSSAPKARFVARRSESVSVQQLARPLGTYPEPSFLPCSPQASRFRLRYVCVSPYLLLQRSTWACRRASTRCWTRSASNASTNLRSDATYTASASSRSRSAPSSSSASTRSPTAAVSASSPVRYRHASVIAAVVYFFANLDKWSAR